jgi:hypothetical protein
MQGKSAPEAGAEQAVYVGIDVCKAWLDVYRIMAHLKLQYITKDRITCSSERERQILLKRSGNRRELFLP